MNENPGFYSIFRLIMHNNPGFCSIFRDFAAFLGSTCTKKPSTCMLNMDSLEVAASVGSDAQDLVHDSRGPLSPLLSLAGVYIFRPDSCYRTYSWDFGIRNTIIRDA